VYELNGIIYAGDPKPILKVKSVRADDDYKLYLTFNTGEKKIYDFSIFLNSGVFTKLKDKEYFKCAHVDSGTVAWGDNLDISGETLYYGGITV
jgi:hypothetical protein